MGKGENTNLFRRVMYFNGLSKEDQLRVIDALEGDPHTLNALVNIGWAPESFSNLDPEVQKRLLALAKDNEKLARRLNLGAAFAKAGPDVKALMIDCLNTDELRAAFAFQLGLNFADLTDEAFDDASKLILSDERMTVMFAYGAGAASLTLQDSVLQKLISLAKSNHVFARNYGRSFIQSIRNSNRLDSSAKLSSVELILKNAKGELADAICDEVSKDPAALLDIAAQLSGNDELVSKLALQLSKNIKNYRGSKQEALIQSLISNSSLALAFCSSAYSLGLNLIHEFKDDKLESLLRSSPALATCLGAHTGKELNGLNRKERRKIIEMAKRYPALASGLADGIKECKEGLSNEARADIDELAARSEDFRRRLAS